MQIVSIQILRALAALAVTIGHAQTFINAPLEKLGIAGVYSHLLPWAAGVDLFFVISGFIMVYASERLFCAPDGYRTFMWRRISRIVPLYWSATALLLASDWLRHKPLPDLAAVAASFFFLPYDTMGTGTPRPVYELGWTLNYEFFFYAIFALFIFLPRSRAVAATATTLGALILLGAIFRFENPLLNVWSQPITLEFVFGMGIALVARRGAVLPDAARYGLMGAALIALLIDLLDASHHLSQWVTPNDFARVFAWGVPGAMLLAAVVLKKAGVRAPGRIERIGSTLGDASYALYLCHPFVLMTFSLAWRVAGVHQWLSPLTGAALGVVVSCLVALVVHARFERPLTRYLQTMRPEARVSATARAL